MTSSSTRSTPISLAYGASGLDGRPAVGVVGEDEGHLRLAAGVLPAFLHPVEEDADLARVVDAAGEVVGRLLGIGQVPGVRAGDVRHLVLGDERPQRLGVRRAVAEHQQHLVVLDELLVGGDGARRLEAVLHADQLELPAVDAALLVDVRHRVVAALGDVLALVRGGPGEVHQVADLDVLRVGRDSAQAEGQQSEENKRHGGDERGCDSSHDGLLVGTLRVSTHRATASSSSGTAPRSARAPWARTSGRR